MGRDFQQKTQTISNTDGRADLNGPSSTRIVRTRRSCVYRNDT